MAESLSLRPSLEQGAPKLSPSILVVEGNMPSMSSSKGPFSSPEVPTTDRIGCCMDKIFSYLNITAQCLVRVQEMPSLKFNNFQCEYLVAKLEVIVESANLFLGPNVRPRPEVKLRTSEDMTICTEVFGLLLALAFKIESFIRGCCKDEWLQAAMTLTNTAEYVASLGFDLELCRVYFSLGGTASKALTAAEVDSIDRIEVEIVQRKASLDVDVLLKKVILELPSLRGQDEDLAIYLLQRLNRTQPDSTSLSPDSPFCGVFDGFGLVLISSDVSEETDSGLVDRTFHMVRQTGLLGIGASATVYKAEWLGMPVAKKIFYGPEYPDYYREVQILEGLCHPNIISMFCCAMDERKCSIVMELMDEDLHSFMQRRLEASPHSPPFSIFEAVDVIQQIGEAVSYLHQNSIVHRDLKPSNVFVKYVLPPEVEVQYVHIKVADFGLSRIKKRSTRYTSLTLNIGTSPWMAPETIDLLNTDGQKCAPVPPAEPMYLKKADVYSFGITCYEILTGDLPFHEELSQVNVKKKVLMDERPPLPDYCPSELKALIEACWDREPTHRPSFRSICLRLKHLKGLLINGFNSSENSRVVIGEQLRVSPENTPSEALLIEMGERRSPDISESLPMWPVYTSFEDPTREMVVRKRRVEGGLVKSLLTVWTRPLRVFISHAGGPNGSGKNFALRLCQSLMSHRWSRSKFHVKPFLDVENCPAGLSFARKIFKELARFDVGLVVVTPAFFERRWPMTELIKFVEVQKQDRDGRIRVLPLFYDLTAVDLRQGLRDKRWEPYWVKLSAGNHPLQLQQCRDAVYWLYQQRGVHYMHSEKRGYDEYYLDTILEAVDRILCAERSYVADLRWAMSLLRRN